MDEIKKVLSETLGEGFVSAVLSGAFSKDPEDMSKVVVRRVSEKGETFFQCALYKNRQVFHYNGDAEETSSRMLSWMPAFKQTQISTEALVYTILRNRKGTTTIKKHRQQAKVQAKVQGHNREKQYILQEGSPVPFLVDLGVMTKEGKVVRSMYHKFRQINRFLEFVQDVLPVLRESEPIRILDFGCGKAYLTFAMYYYLHELSGLSVEMIGLDLKRRVVQDCNALCEKYGYEKLVFQEGDIADFTGNNMDMVVSLHACDLATDYAIQKAIQKKAKVIFAVPCCQHELNGQIKSELLAPVLSYGIVKERMAALFTDALRAQYMEKAGYDTCIMEFIELEHTPKNLLIRGIYTGKETIDYEAVQALERELGVHPTMKRLIGEIE